MSHKNILQKEKAVLVVVDMQDALLKVIHENDLVTENCAKLVQCANVFEVPVLVTLQYQARLGDVTEGIATHLAHDDATDKMTFSCCGSQGFVSELQKTGKEQVILCGIETHVCVNQTAHDLLAAGYSVHIVSDAVSSRTPENKLVGLEKMRDSGCVIASTEMAVFELTKEAGTERFKEILPLVK